MVPETLDFISLVPWTFVAMIANVYILYRLMRRFLFKPVQGILEKRQKAVDSIYDEANKTKSDAEQIKNQYEQKLNSADVEAKVVIASATDAARKQENEIIVDAKLQARHIITKAETNAEQIQRKAAIALKDDISEMAIDIARKVTQKEINQETHQKLIEDCIKHFEEGKQ